MFLDDDYGDVDAEHQYRFNDTKNVNDYIKSLDCATKTYDEFITHKHAGVTVRVNCADKLDKQKRANLRREADNVTRMLERGCIVIYFIKVN
jgi:hypothetical protein